MSLNHRSNALASILGLMAATLTFTIQSLSSVPENPVMNGAQKGLLVLLIPGLVGSMAISGNVHAFHLWLAAAMNALIYFAVGRLVFLGWTRWKDKKSRGRH